MTDGIFGGMFVLVFVLVLHVVDVRDEVQRIRADADDQLDMNRRDAWCRLHDGDDAIYTWVDWYGTSFFFRCRTGWNVSTRAP